MTESRQAMETLGVRIEREALRKLDAAAKRDMRSVSGLVRLIVMRWLAEQPEAATQA
jgi:hypothetical protein